MHFLKEIKIRSFILFQFQAFHRRIQMYLINVVIFLCQ